jgi:hypothetical protein
MSKDMSDDTGKSQQSHFVVEQVALRDQQQQQAASLPTAVSEGGSAPSAREAAPAAPPPAVTKLSAQDEFLSWFMNGEPPPQWRTVKIRLRVVPNQRSAGAPSALRKCQIRIENGGEWRIESDALGVFHALERDDTYGQLSPQFFRCQQDEFTKVAIMRTFMLDDCGQSMFDRPPFAVRMRFFEQDVEDEGAQYHRSLTYEKQSGGNGGGGFGCVSYTLRYTGPWVCMWQTQFVVKAVDFT